MALYSATLQGQALSASTAKTLLQLATAASDRIKVVEFGLSFDGVTASNPPVKVELMRQTTAGTMSAGTIVKLDPSDGTSATTATQNATAEPTASDVIGAWLVSPAAGVLVIQYPLGREPILAVSTRVGLKVTPGSAITANATAYLVWEE